MLMLSKCINKACEKTPHVLTSLNVNVVRRKLHFNVRRPVLKKDNSDVSFNKTTMYKVVNIHVRTEAR